MWGQTCYLRAGESHSGVGVLTKVDHVDPHALTGDLCPAL